MDKFFKLTERGTSFQKEVLAGVTTFLTMSYIIFVNPSILSQTGMSYSSVFIATCIAAAMGTFLIGILANLPFAQAPGMGLTAFFTFTVVFSLGYTWQQALAVVFLSGLLFLFLTITGLRRRIIDAIPLTLKLSIAPGIGMFIAFIGMNNAGLIEVNQGPIIDIILNNDTTDKGILIDAVNSAPSQVLQLGSVTDHSELLTFIGLVILIVLMVRQVKAALIWSILLTTLIGIPLGVTQLPDSYNLTDIDTSTFFAMDLKGLFQDESEWRSAGFLLNLVVLVISFTLIDLLDTLGTLIGTAKKGGLLSPEGEVPNMNRALLADASATTIGSFLGTSSVTTYIESSAGVIEGGRTGLTSIVSAILFLLAIVLAPIAGIVPVAATSPVLIVVGVLMMDGVRDLDFSRMEVLIPSVLLIFMMPFSYSIANGIAFGVISYVIIQIALGKFREVSPLLYGLSVIFVLKWVLVG